MGLERITDSLIATYGYVKKDLAKDKAYLAAAGAYAASRVMDAYTTHLAYHAFEEVGEMNEYVNFMVQHLGTPEGIIVGIGIPSVVALALTKILNERFIWTKHWGTAALVLMAGLAGYAACHNLDMYLQNT